MPLPKRPTKPTTRVEKLMLQRQRVLGNKATAKSAAHEGVVERPMDKNLSKLLEIRRAQKIGRGTSVVRLNEKETEEKDAETTSVGRMKVDRLQLNRLKPIPNSKKPDYGDLS
jgi:hypothetical protein